MKQEIFNEINIKIGKNSKENWDLIKNSQEEWLWFHLKSFPSCHVIVESEIITKDLIYQGAKLCKENSKYKNHKNLKISYCKIKNIQLGEKEGSVCFKSNRQVKEVKI